MQMFGFKHTINKLNYSDSDHKLIRTRLYSRLLLVKAPTQLESLYPQLSAQLDSSLHALGDETSLPIAQTIRRLVSGIISSMFFGKVLSELQPSTVLGSSGPTDLPNAAADEEFSNALLQYPRDMIKYMAAFQVTPTILSP